VIAITFDDGPGRLLTPQIRQRLAQAKVPATFFILGCNLAGHEDLVRQLQQDGHELGLHGDRHLHHLRSLPWSGVCDLRAGAKRLESLLGPAGAGLTLRPPYGKLNLLSLLWCVLRRQRLASWTHDGFDTRAGVEKSPQQLAEDLRASGGGVLLLHDFDRALANAGQQVLAKLDAVLALQSEGYRFVGWSAVLAPD
jgi:peptidoglycan/xylan/chitin deacetylase (PgdA/CDA1 family)